MTIKIDEKKNKTSAYKQVGCHLRNMKKHILIVIMKIICASLISAQSVSDDSFETISFKDIQYIEDIKVSDDFTYCLGYSFKKDGYGSYSRLNKYDKKLNLVWSLKIDSNAKNQFDKIGTFENKIFISGVHGVSTNRKLNVSRFLYSISMNGKILEKVNFGQSVIPATNLEYYNNSIWISYTEPENIEFGKGTNICVVASYNLKDKKVNTFKGKISSAYPRKIFVEDSCIFVFGDHEKNNLDKIQEQFIIKISNDELTEKVIETDKMEWFINTSVDSKQKLIYVYSVFRGVYGDNDKFLKVSTFGFDLTAKKNKKIPFADIGLTDIQFESCSNNSDVWVLAESENRNLYLKLDKSGIPNQMIDLEPIGKYPKSILILPEKQIQIVNKTLKITNEHPTMYKRH